ncbi:MAG: carbohydrate-binding protein [Verrucomicrobiota bacterium]
MKTKIVSLLAALLVLCGSTTAQVNFDKTKDLFLAQFDSKPDPDDIHSIAAVGCMMAHPDLHNVDFYAVQGTVGRQGGQFIPAPALMTMAFGQQNVRWTQAGNGQTNTTPGTANWNASVDRVRVKAKAALDRGGKVYIMEAGNSDFSHDWIQELVSQTSYTTTDTQQRIIVVQHQIAFNEGQTTPAKLAWVKANTDYRNIGDGNGAGNGTPDYQQNVPNGSFNDTFSSAAEAASNPNTHARDMWLEAESAIVAVLPRTPTNQIPTYSSIRGRGVDFSDAVEAWYIFNLGTTVDNIQKFWNRYVTNTNSANGPVPGPLGSPGGNGTPFGGTARAVPGTIQAEDFNVGSQGTAYNDTGASNVGSSNYRSGTGVDIYEGNSQDPARIIGSIANGEWLEYDVDVTPGTFNIEARVAAQLANSSVGDLAVSIDGTSLGTFSVVNTGGWRSFQTVTIPNVTLGVGGIRNLRLTAVGGNFNLDLIRFVSTGNSGNTGPFRYDLGTSGSPVQSGFTRVSQSTTAGTFGWTNTSGLGERDRGAGGSRTNITRDLVFSPQARTFRQQLANGSYSVTVSVGDTFAVDDIVIKAEGVTKASNIDRAANQYQNVQFNVDVTDGNLDIEFSDGGGANPNWVVNSIEISQASSVSAQFDLGTGSSPVQSEYTRVSQSTAAGSFGWTNMAGLGERDRGAGGSRTSLTRDLVFSSQPRTFKYDIANGTYNVSVTIGDIYAVDDIVIKAEGQTKASNIDRAVDQYQDVTFSVTVSDGSLDIEFSDAGGANPNWVVNAITII